MLGIINSYRRDMDYDNTPNIADGQDYQEYLRHQVVKNTMKMFDSLVEQLKGTPVQMEELL